MLGTRRDHVRPGRWSPAAGSPRPRVPRPAWRSGGGSAADRGAGPGRRRDSASSIGMRTMRASSRRARSVSVINWSYAPVGGEVTLRILPSQDCHRRPGSVRVGPRRNNHRRIRRPSSGPAADESTGAAPMLASGGRGARAAAAAGRCPHPAELAEALGLVPAMSKDVLVGSPLGPLAHPGRARAPERPRPGVNRPSAVPAGRQPALRRVWTYGTGQLRAKAPAGAARPARACASRRGTTGSAGTPSCCSPGTPGTCRSRTCSTTCWARRSGSGSPWTPSQTPLVARTQTR